MIIFKFIAERALRREIERVIYESGLFDDFQGSIRFYDQESVYLEGDFTERQLILLARILNIFGSKDMS